MRRRRAIASAVLAAAVAASGVTSYLVVHRERAPVEQRASRPTRFYEVHDTQEIRFQASRVGRPWNRPVRQQNMIAQVRHAMTPYHGKGFQLKAPGSSQWGSRHILGETLYRLRHGIHRTHIGKVWRVRPVKRHSFVWRAHSTDIDPAKIADTEGTHAIDIVVGSTLHRFPGLTLIGIYVCRYIAGTTTLSQHAYGNAVDWGGSQSLLTATAKWQYMMTKRGWLPMAQLLWQGHDWFSGGYVYDHYDHLHDSGKPMLSGGCNRPGYGAARAPTTLAPSASPIYEGPENGEGATPTP